MIITAIALMVTGGVLFLGVLGYLALIILRRPARVSPMQQTRLDYLNARERVDSVLLNAKQRMEVRIGLRRPGERRMADSLGSWRDLL